MVVVMVTNHLHQGDPDMWRYARRVAMAKKLKQCRPHFGRLVVTRGKDSDAEIVGFEVLRACPSDTSFQTHVRRLVLQRGYQESCEHVGVEAIPLRLFEF